MQTFCIVLGLVAIAFAINGVASTIKSVANSIKKFTAVYDLNESVKNKQLIKNVADELAEEANKEESTVIEITVPPKKI